MPKITIDEVEYNTEDLSDNGKAQLASLQFLEVQMVNLNQRLQYIRPLKFLCYSSKNELED